MSITCGRLPARIRREMSKYPPFYRKVWCACAAIPKGQTITYGELAKRIGCAGGARAVGQALGKNPFAPTVPCHRVVRADGAPGGYSGPGGIKAKLRMINAEKREAAAARRGKR